MRLFTKDRSFYSTLVKLALPIALQNFITFGVAFGDNVMVGQLGDAAISGVYMGNQLQMFLQFFVTGVESAMLILAAQYWGRGDLTSIKKIIGSASKFVMVAGAIFTAIVAIFPKQMIGIFTNDPLVIEQGAVYVSIVCWSYIFFCISQIMISAMRAVEKSTVGMYVSLCTLVFDVGLNYVMIFGKLGFPAMGIKGAALSTVISRALEATILMCYVLIKDKKLQLKLQDLIFRGERTLTRDLFKYGTPVFMGQIVWAVNTLSQSAIIGRMGKEAISAVSITGMLNSLLFMAVLGFAAALGILTGKTVGAGQYQKMKEYAVTAQVLFALVGVFSAIVIMLLRNPFISLYNITDKAVEVAKQFTIVMAIASAGRAYQATCLAGLVKAGGDVGFVFKNDTIFVFGVVLPSALLAMFVFNAPPWVVYACLQSDQILKCFVAIVKINKFNWMKNLTRSREEIQLGESLKKA